MTRSVDGIGRTHPTEISPGKSAFEKDAPAASKGVQGYAAVTGDGFSTSSGDVWPAEVQRHESLQAFVGRPNLGASAAEAAELLCAELESLVSTGVSQPGRRSLPTEAMVRIEALLSGPLASDGGIRDIGWEGRRNLMTAVRDANAALMANEGWQQLGGRLTYLLARCEQAQDTRSGTRRLRTLADDLLAKGNFDAAAFAYNRLASVGGGDVDKKSMRSHSHLAAVLAHVGRGERPPADLLRQLKRAGKSSLFGKSHLALLCAELGTPDGSSLHLSAETIATLQKNGEGFFVDGLQHLGATRGEAGSLSFELQPRSLESMLAAGSEVGKSLGACLTDIRQLRAELETAARDASTPGLSKEERNRRLPAIQKRCLEINTRLEEAGARAREAAIAMQQSLLANSPISSEQADELVQWIPIDDRAAAVLPAAQIRAQLAMMVRLTGGQGLMQVGRITSSSKRASAKRGDGELNVGGELRSSQAPLLHEFAHFVEYDSPSLFAAAAKWRQSHATGSAIKHLNDLIPGGKYAPDEVAWEGEFLNPYVGRHYEGEEATEVISVGLEHFVSPQRLVDFAAKAEEHFQLVVGALAG